MRNACRTLGRIDELAYCFSAPPWNQEAMPAPLHKAYESKDSPVLHLDNPVHKYVRVYNSGLSKRSALDPRNNSSSKSQELRF